MERIPQHIAIIMDGNGRWATERGKERSYGHQAGVESVRRITSECTRLGVKYLTLYTFSTENWNRPADEVAALMGLVLTALEDELFMKNDVRFQVIGDIDRLPEVVQEKLQETIDHTADNKAMTMVIALSYSSRWEITKAVKEISTLVAEGKAKADDINEDFISQASRHQFHARPRPADTHRRRAAHIKLPAMADRIYLELYFCDTYWPDFAEADLHKAIASYQLKGDASEKDRGTGGTGEKLRQQENKKTKDYTT